MCFTVELSRRYVHLGTKVPRSRLRRIYNLHNKHLGKQASHILILRLCTYFSIAKLLVAMRLGETPVPIPNTTVKT